jgi:hypothetical protein
MLSPKCIDILANAPLYSSCLPCCTPGKCGNNRLQAHPKGKHELKELWAQAKRWPIMYCTILATK